MTQDPGIPLPNIDGPAATSLDRLRQREQALLAELQSTRAELERARQMRDEFMAMVVHELRTPLGVLALEVRVRQHQLGADNPAFFARENLARMFERDQRQVRSMSRLIDDMLDAEKIQNGHLALRPAHCALGALLRRVVAQMQELYGEVALTLVAEGAEISGHWDEFRLEQVMVNLLANALRYGSGQPVRVVLETGPGVATIHVSDRGIGIAADDQARVFDRFARVGEHLRMPGLGLGLFISRQLVEAHGGRIDLSSAPGQGSTFTVRLPTLPSP